MNGFANCPTRPVLHRRILDDLRVIECHNRSAESRAAYKCLGMAVWLDWTCDSPHLWLALEPKIDYCKTQLYTILPLQLQQIIRPFS